VLVQDTKVELVWPPIAVRCAAAGGFRKELTMVEGAFGFGGHKFRKGWGSYYDGVGGEVVVFFAGKKKWQQADFKKYPRR
jgi:hypothetical protein